MQKHETRNLRVSIKNLLITLYKFHFIRAGRKDKNTFEYFLIIFYKKNVMHVVRVTYYRVALFLIFFFNFILSSCNYLKVSSDLKVYLLVSYK